MEEITVKIGSIVVGNSGITNDTRQDVEFMGDKLGEYREYGTDRNGNITDTRGVTETLYRAADGRLVVHTNDWSHWVGEPNTESLLVVTQADLQPTGRFAQLGAACGFGRPLTLAEAIGGVRLTSSGAFVDKEPEDTSPALIGKAGFLFEVLGDDNEDWDMIESFGDWLREVAGGSTAMGHFLGYVDDLRAISPNQTRDPDTDEDEPMPAGVGGALERSRWQFFIDAMKLDTESFDTAAAGYGFDLSLYDDMTELDRQHAIALFATGLVGLAWHEKSAVIGRLTDAVLGVLDDDYFAALEAGHFDTSDS